MTAWLGGAGTADDAPVRLFCFPHAGGGGRFFTPWRRPLLPDLSVRPIVPPGREHRFREAPYVRMEPLVAELVEALRPELDRPFAFFGHSLGAAVAFETALRLRRLGLPEPACLLVSARRAPQLPPLNLHLMEDEQFVAEIVRLNGLPAKILDRPKVLQFFLPTLRADYELNDTWRPTLDEPLSCPIIGYCGAADPLAQPPEVAAWAAITDGDFRFRVFSGDHFYLRDRPEEVLAALRADLAATAVITPVAPDTAATR